MKTMAAWLLLLMASTALATQPAILVDHITMESGAPSCLMVLPDGSGPALAQAQGPDGSILDATIQIQLVTEYGAAIPGFPGEDVWLDTEESGLTACQAGIHPEMVADNLGVMTFSGPFQAGGHHTGGTYVYVNGFRALDFHQWPAMVDMPPVPLSFNSPDINGDLVVNLTDIGLFSADFFGGYDFRSDFHHDGVLNLTDVGRFAFGLGTSCP